MNAGSLEIQLLANIARLQQDMDNATRTVGNAMSNISASVAAAVRSFGGLVAGAAAAAAAYLSFGSVVDGVKASIERLAKLDDSSQKTGSSIVESLSRLQKVAMMVGADFGVVDKGVFNLAKTLGGTGAESDKARAALARLGISAKDIAGQDTAATFIQTAKSLQKYKDDAGKSALMNDIFKKSAEELLPFMNDVSEHVDKFAGRATESAARASEFQDNLGLMGVRASEFFDLLADNLLPSLVAFTGEMASGNGVAKTFKEYLDALSKSGKLKEWAEATGNAIRAMFNILVPAMKVAAAYFAIFVAAPAIYAVVAAATWKVIAAVATYTMNVLIGQAATIKWNVALFGTSISADWATASLTRMGMAAFVVKAAMGALFAVIAGYQFGTYLSENFTEARIAGMVFVATILTGWEHIKYGAEMAWEGIKFAWNVTVHTMKNGFADFVSFVAKGYSLIGMSETSKDVEAYANSLRAAAGPQKTFAEQTAGITAAHKAAIDAIDANIVDMIALEQATDGVTASTVALAKEKDKPSLGKGKGDPEAIKKELESFTNLMTAVKEKISITQQEIASVKPLNEAQKLQVALTEQLASGKLKLTPLHKAAYEAAIKEYGANLALIESHKSVAQAIKVLEEERDSDYASAIKEAQASELLVETFGMSKYAIEAQTLARMENRLAQRADLELGEKEVAQLERMIAAKQRHVAATGKLGELGQATDLTKATQLLEVMSAIDEAAQKAASGMAASFGRIGTAIGGMTTAISGFGKEQAAIQADYVNVVQTASGTTMQIQAKIAAAAQLAAERTAKSQISAYSNMAGAAKSFFKEGTGGYKALEAAEKTFRAVEMAMAIESMLVKSGLLTGFTSLFIANKATEATVETASTTKSIIGSGMRAAADGVAAVAKAIASMPFPYNLAAGAATVAALAAIGVRIAGSGGGGGPTAADVQKSQGAGGVFGDTSAKSDSIARSIELLKSNSDVMVPINRGMLSALRNIESSMTGLTNLLVRVPGLTNGTNMGIATGPFDIGKPTDAISRIGTVVTQLSFPGLGGTVAKFLNNLWGKSKTDIVDAGLQFGGSVSELQAGRGYNQYSSANTTKSSWFGLVKKTTNSVETAGLDSELSDQFGKIFTNLEEALSLAAQGLGLGANHVASILDTLTIATTTISLKGLTGTALTEALNAVISKTMDTMAEAVFPSMDRFRQVGEGYAETIIRIASNYANLDVILASIGKTFGATGLASLDARERLIELAGGIEALAAQTQSFSETYLTEAERMAPVIKFVTEQMALLGYAGVTTRDQFKTVVLGLDLTTEAGAKQYTALMSLESAFAKVYPVIEATTAALVSAAQVVAADVAAAYDNAGKAVTANLRSVASIVAGLGDAARAAATKLVASQDAISQAYFTAQDAEVAARKKVVDATRQSIDAFTKVGTTIRDFIKGLTGATGTASFATLKAQLETTAALAQGGDTKSQEGLTTIARSFLDAAKERSTDAVSYARDEANVRRLLNGVADAMDVRAASLASGTPGAGIAAEDPIVAANRELLAAQLRLADLAAMAAATGASTDRSTQHIAGSAAALLIEFQRAAADNASAQATSATALVLTSNLALATTNGLTGLMGGLATLSESQATFIRARDELAAYVISVEVGAGDLDAFARSVAASLGLTGEAAMRLVRLLTDTGPAVSDLVGAVGLTGTAADGLTRILALPAPAVDQLVAALGLTGAAASTLSAFLHAPGAAVGTLIQNLQGTGAGAVALAASLAAPQTAVSALIGALGLTGAAADGLARFLGLPGQAAQDMVAALGLTGTAAADLTSLLRGPATSVAALIASFGLTSAATAAFTQQLGPPGTAAQTLATLLGSGAIKISNESVALALALGLGNTAIGGLGQAAQATGTTMSGLAGAFSAEVSFLVHQMDGVQGALPLVITALNGGPGSLSGAAAGATTGLAGMDMAALLATGAVGNFSLSALLAARAMGDVDAATLLATGSLTTIDAAALLAASSISGVNLSAALASGSIGGVSTASILAASAIGGIDAAALLASGSISNVDSAAILAAASLGGIDVAALLTSSEIRWAGTASRAAAVEFEGVSAAASALAGLLGAAELGASTVAMIGSLGIAEGAAMSIAASFGPDGVSGAANTVTSALGLTGIAAQRLVDLFNSFSITTPTPATPSLSVNEQAISALYRDVLGRAADTGGLAYWSEALTQGTITLAAAAEMIARAGAAQYDDPLGNHALGWSAATAMADDTAGTAWLRARQIPGFAVGTNEVPYDMLARIHAGERIIPAADNRELMSRLRSGGDSSGLVAAIDELRVEVAALGSSAGQTAVNTGRTADSAKRLYDVTNRVTNGGEGMVLES